MVLDDEDDENDSDNNLTDHGGEVQTLESKWMKDWFFISVINYSDILGGHTIGRVSNGWAAIGVGNGKPDGWGPVNVAPGRFDGCSGNCGRFGSYK